MTNPIPEYIDKQKLLEWLNGLASTVYIHDISNAITLGTFDDHSTQEEIAKLREERDEYRRLWEFRAIRSIKAARQSRSIRKETEARALQAERELEEVKIYFYADRHLAEREKLREERNALLETMKQIVRHIGNGDYGTAKDTASSIIAKIEGNNCDYCDGKREIVGNLGTPYPCPYCSELEGSKPE